MAKPWVPVKGDRDSVYNLLPAVDFGHFVHIVKEMLAKVYPFRTPHEHKTFEHFLGLYRIPESSCPLGRLPFMKPVYSYVKQIAERVRYNRFLECSFIKKTFSCSAEQMKQVMQLNTDVLRTENSIKWSASQEGVDPVVVDAYWRQPDFKHLYSCSSENMLSVMKLGTSALRNKNVRLWNDGDRENSINPALVSDYWTHQANRNTRWLFDITKEEWNECRVNRAFSNYDEKHAADVVRKLFDGQFGDYLSIVVSFAMCWKMSMHHAKVIQTLDLPQFMSVEKIEENTPIDPTPFFEQDACRKLFLPNPTQPFSTDVDDIAEPKRAFFTPKTLVHMVVKESTDRFDVRLPLEYAQYVYGNDSNFRIQLETLCASKNPKPALKISPRKPNVLRQKPSPVLYFDRLSKKQIWVGPEDIKFEYKIERKEIISQALPEKIMTPVPKNLTMDVIAASYENNWLGIKPVHLISAASYWIKFEETRNAKLIPNFQYHADIIQIRGHPFPEDNFIELDRHMYPSADENPWCWIFRPTGKSPRKYINVFK